MSLFLAFLLLYHFDMSWWWYLAASGVWIAHCAVNPVILGLFD